MGKPKPRKARFNMPVGRNTKVNRLKQRNDTEPAGQMKYIYKVSPITNTSLQFTFQKFVQGKEVRHTVVQGCRNVFTRWYSPTNPLDGYRLVNLDLLSQHVTRLTCHSLTCAAAHAKMDSGQISTPIKLVADVKHQGLASILLAECQGCGVKFYLPTSPKIDSSQTHKRYDINVRGVWGAMVSGGGVSRLNETMATMGVPGMTQSTFGSIEGEIGEWWKGVLEQDMKAAGAEERRLAIERNDMCDGVPAITVICDGGWSKRTHKHTYSAMGGVAIIIGAETKKLLHIGVRNKHCYVCTLADTKQQEPPQHDCFKNWTESSQAMEADVIVEGFLKAEATHGVRYTRLIGDGDSSVFARVQEQVPIWGRKVTKLECANHACKCLRSNLEKLVTDYPHYKGHGKLTLATRVRLATGVRCAIRMRSAETNRVRAVPRLRHDIRNSVFHVFGIHNNCSDFFKARQELPNQEHRTLADDTDESPSTQAEDVSDQVLQDQMSYWTEGTSTEAMEESRGATSINTDKIDPDILRDVTLLLNRQADKADKLLGNYTTNLAECWMSIRCKFDGGKFFNRCNRGSWHARCYGGALRQNLGPQWSPTVWRRVTGTDPGGPFKACYCSRTRRLVNSRLSKRKPDVRARAKKRRTKGKAQGARQKARMEYGEEAVEVVPDMDAPALEIAKDGFLKKEVTVTPKRMKEIEELTRQQSDTTLWGAERRKRLTSSVFGEIFHRRPSLAISPIVRRLLYGKFAGNRFTLRGLKEEDMSKKEYVIHQSGHGVNCTVESVGLVIHPTVPFLAASPDGKVTETGGACGLLEIKNVLMNKQWTFREAVVKQPNFCLHLQNGKLQLKRRHKFYFQCQGQVNIADLPWVDIMVRRTNPHEILVERLYRDTVQWESEILPKLSAFYMKCLLPELASRRFGLSPGIREPGTWFEAPSSTVGEKTGPGRQKRKGQLSAAASSPKQSTSTASAPEQSTSTASAPEQSASTALSQRTRRIRREKFVGRRITHEWIDENTGEHEWWRGTVLDVVSGRDGDPTAVYDIYYNREGKSFRVDHLYEDWTQGSVKFVYD